MRSSLCMAILLLAAAATLPSTLDAQETNKVSRDRIELAREAIQKGKFDESLAFLNEAIEAEPKKIPNYFLRAQVYQAKKEHAKAIADYDQVILLEGKGGHGYLYRGMEFFRAGKIQESIADFDSYARENPSQAPQLWQRGISHYYAKKFADGQRQFEIHQKVNSNDVENSVWHFLCVAQLEGKEKAKAVLIPVQRDTRVPMMQILSLFAGKATPKDVLDAVERGAPPKAERDHRLFYAHLYLGLYHEAMGDHVKAEEHITQAVGPYKADHYMGDVARVHARLRGYAISKSLP